MPRTKSRKPRNQNDSIYPKDPKVAILPWPISRAFALRPLVLGTIKNHPQAEMDFTWTQMAPDACLEPEAGKPETRA